MAGRKGEAGGDAGGKAGGGAGAKGAVAAGCAGCHFSGGGVLDCCLDGADSDDHFCLLHRGSVRDCRYRPLIYCGKRYAAEAAEKAAAEAPAEEATEAPAEEAAATEAAAE